jgi:hypothetical protein
LIYIADLFYKFACSTHSDADLRTAMNVTISLRSAIYDASNLDIAELAIRDCKCSKVKILYNYCLPVECADTLVKLLNSAIPDRSGHIVIENARSGSLVIDTLVIGTITVSGMLAALNVILRQATVVINTTTSLSKAWNDFKTSNYSSANAVVTQKNLGDPNSKLAAIERNSGLAEAMKPVYNAVKEAGHVTTQLDREAEVFIDLDQ